MNAVAHVDDATAFEVWLAAASAGDRAIYAIAREFPRHLSTSILAGAWLRRGLVVTVYQRQSDGTKHFIAERTAKSLFDVARAPRSATTAQGEIAEDVDDGPGEIILRQIRRHANFNLPAPTLREMAKAAGLTDDEAGKAAARRALQALANAGHVRHENSQGSHKRRFILADGRKTGWLTLRGAS